MEMATVFSLQIHRSTFVTMFSALISNGPSRYLKILSLISGGRSEKVTGFLSGIVGPAGTIVSASSEAMLAAELVIVVSSGTAKVLGKMFDIFDIGAGYLNEVLDWCGEHGRSLSESWLCCRTESKHSCVCDVGMVACAAGYLMLEVR